MRIERQSVETRQNHDTCIRLERVKDGAELFGPALILGHEQQPMRF